jgi:hypothetical protein
MNMGIYLGIIMLFLFCVFQLFISQIIKGFKQPEQHLDLSDLMNTLNETIKREFTVRLKLNYELRDVKIIYDFQRDLHDLVNGTLTSFSPDFYNQLQYYYTREYIIQYVTKTIEIMLIEYTKNNKIKTK